MQRRTVLLIRSQELGWTELRLVLQSMNDVRVVGEATNAARGIELAILLNPDVIIAAAELEGTSLLPLLIDLHRSACATSRIILLASQLHPHELVAIDDVDFVGYLLWSDLSSETLRLCLAAVIVGDFVVASRAVAKAFIEAQRCAARAASAPTQLSSAAIRSLRPI